MKARPVEHLRIFNDIYDAASSLIKYRHSRKIDMQGVRDLLQEAYGHKLVQFGENVQQNMNFIFNCCGCCEEMIVARRFTLMNIVHTTSFIPFFSEEKGTGCGKCVIVCSVEAMSVISTNNRKKSRMKTRLEEDICLDVASACAYVLEMEFILAQDLKE